MKRSELIRRKKEELKNFFQSATPEEKLKIIENWYDSDTPKRRFNRKLLDAVKGKHEKHGLSKGDIVYIDTVFSAFDINPYKFGAKK